MKRLLSIVIAFVVLALAFAAQPAKKNVPNPFKPGEVRDIPAKPAHNKIKVKALKALKDMA